jgi:hypothetical protein
MLELRSYSQSRLSTKREKRESQAWLQQVRLRKSGECEQQKKDLEDLSKVGSPPGYSRGDYHLE